jgi:hypothetical protein
MRTMYSRPIFTLYNKVHTSSEILSGSLPHRHMSTSLLRLSAVIVTGNTTGGRVLSKLATFILLARLNELHVVRSLFSFFQFVRAR